jgi:hypothetical protein
VWVFRVSANTPQMVSTAAAPQAEVLLQEIFVGSGIKFAGVIGVDGRDGIRKTSLLKFIHNNYKKVSDIHFDLVIWFKVSTPESEGKKN